MGKLHHVGIVVAHIRVAGLVQRRRHANDRRVALRQDAVVDRGAKRGAGPFDGVRSARRAAKTLR